MVIEVDVLVVGQGLAGSALVWRLAERGLSVIVVDRGGVDHLGAPSSSRVAAGLITPVTGKRLTVAEDFDPLRREATRFYRRIERATRSTLLDEQPAVRVFVDSDERDLFERRMAAGEYGEHARAAQTNELPAGLPAPWGGFVSPTAARLRVTDFLLATRGSLSAEDRFIKGEAPLADGLRIEPARVVIEPYGVAGKRLVLCQGYTPEPPPWLRGVRLAPAKGEVLTVAAPRYKEDRVVHRGVWIAPERGGRYLVGATTQWDRLDPTPTHAARAELLDRLAAAGVASASVLDHRAAVRPATHDRQPTYGFDAEQPLVGWFNGLGAKGALWAPAYAERMVELVERSLRA